MSLADRPLTERSADGSSLARSCHTGAGAAAGGVDDLWHAPRPAALAPIAPRQRPKTETKRATARSTERENVIARNVIARTESKVRSSHTY
jgi:hypothetical protein